VTVGNTWLGICAVIALSACVESSTNDVNTTLETPSLSTPDPSLCGAEVEADGWICAPPGRFELGAGGCYGDPASEFETGVYATVSTPMWVAEAPVTAAEWNEHMSEFVHEFAQDPPDLPFPSATYGSSLLYANRLSEAEGLTPCYDVSEAVGCRPYGYDEYWTDFDCEPGAQPTYDPTCSGYRLPTLVENEWVLRASGNYGWPDMATCTGHPWFGVCLPRVSLWVFDRTTRPASEWGTIAYFPSGEYVDPVLHEVLGTPAGIPLAWLGENQRNTCQDITTLRTIARNSNAGVRLVRTATEGLTLTDGQLR
jgi:hypothetical protein